jgi:hypothetical protein
MARQLTPLGRILIVLSGIALIGYGMYHYRVFSKIAAILAPDRKAEGEVTKDDFGAGGTLDLGERFERRFRQDRHPADRPIKVAIVTWGGYAGGIFANGGNAPNKESLFFKDQGIEVELLVIDDFEKSRDAFRAGGDKGGVDIMWSTVDAFALEYAGSRSSTPRPSSSTTGAAVETRSRSTRRSSRWPISGARSWPVRRPLRRTTSPSTC